MPQALFTTSHALGSRGSLDWLLHRIHALLGTFVLGHFIHRYTSFFLSDANDMGFQASTPFFWLFLPHFCLQVSGLGFQIPPRRHPDGNRIWAEYRWHALAFFFRCMALMFCAWQKKKHGGYTTLLLTAPIDRWLAVVIFLFNLVVVDRITSVFQNRGESSNTIRGLRCSSGLKYLMSAAQFHANVSCLLNNGSMSVPFAALVVVQSSAFGMTLRRKGLIGLELGLVLYSLVLVLGMLVIRRDLLDQGLLDPAFTIGNLAAIVRMDFGVNKYTLWLVLSFLVLMTNTSHEVLDHPTWLYSSRSSTLLLLASAASRSSFGKEEKKAM